VLDEEIVRGKVFVSQCQRSSRAQQLISNRVRANCVFSPAARVLLDAKHGALSLDRGSGYPG